MAKVSNTTVILLVLVVVFLLVVMTSGTQRSDFAFYNAMYQYGKASIDREYNFYDCVEDECKGDTHDYLCLQKCHLQTFRQGMKAPDVQSRVCESYSQDKDAYYRCLASVYADY